MPHDVPWIALAFIACCAAAWLIWIVRVTSRPPITPGQNVLLFLCRLLTRMLWRVEVRMTSPLPTDRGVVLICNHRSSVDPFFFQISFQKPLHWMVAREFVEKPAFRGFLRACEVIPVNRGGIDTAATKQAIRYVAEGGIVGMFPEGRINMTEQLMLPCRPGAALIALKARSWMIPCYIEGSPYRRVAWSPFFMPARVRVTYGEPIDAAPYADRHEDSDDDVPRELLDRAIRALAALAGQPDFEPTWAGRNWKPTAADIEAAATEQESRLRKVR